MGAAPPQQQRPAALRGGVAQCASVAGTAFFKPRTEFENLWGGRQRNGEGRHHSRRVEITYGRLVFALRRCGREGRRAEKALRCMAEGRKRPRRLRSRGAAAACVSRYLDAAFGEVSAVFVLNASFFQVSLPQGNRASFRCRTETGRLVETTRAPIGYECSPEMLHTVVRALVGDPAAVSSRFAAPKSLTIRVWIDNI
ncbi:hypothetical protein ERJ75_001042300 [Trypanosoma vivax]|nr:hypothetical protein TRVL_08127 [Trypanosoma vivax]KAH8611062.1 hypothetical protein ERJ75_001042300 [Trypanosoma vivax]